MPCLSSMGKLAPRVRAGQLATPYWLCSGVGTRDPPPQLLTVCSRQESGHQPLAWLQLQHSGEQGLSLLGSTVELCWYECGRTGPEGVRVGELAPSLA